MNTANNLNCNTPANYYNMFCNLDDFPLLSYNNYLMPALMFDSSISIPSSFNKFFILSPLYHMHFHM